LQQREHFPVGREAPDLPLGEDHLAVEQDVVLVLLARPDRRFETLVRQLGRETRGPAVVTASDGAIEDLDTHAGKG
jgi:hypothetical protein